MEVSPCQTPSICSPFPPRQTSYHRPRQSGWNVALPETGLSLKAGRRGLRNGLPVKCKSQGSGSGSVAEIEEEELGAEKEELMASMGRLRHKCEEKRGLVELLECLECEAVMGEDDGREPTDYNRRAQIFNKSSRVFQALKERQRLF